MYRPHQARETLILRMEREIEEGRREIREMRGVMGKVDGVLRELEEEGREIGTLRVKEVMVKGSPEQERRIGKRLWETMDVDSDGD
jgi:mediator of RNA polymerase II transcription subunit 7